MSFGKREKREVRAGHESLTSNTGSIFQKGIKIKESGSSSQSPRGGSANHHKSSGTRAKDISTDKKFISSVALQHKIDSLSLRRGSWAALNNDNLIHEGYLSHSDAEVEKRLRVRRPMRSRPVRQTVE